MTEASLHAMSWESDGTFVLQKSLFALQNC